MSILIKGMEMPDCCTRCDYLGLNVAIGCPVMTGVNGRATDCPIIEVPPHGRLIDADALEKKFCSHCDDYMSGKDECKEGCFDLKIIKSMPTVIPADKDGET